MAAGNDEQRTGQRERRAEPLQRADCSMPSTAEIRSTVIGDSAMISAMWIAVVDTPAA